MLKKVLVVLASSLLLSGCGLGYESINPQSQADTCKQLKRQLLYNNSNHNQEACWVTSTQKQALIQKLKDNHCDGYN